VAAAVLAALILSGGVSGADELPTYDISISGFVGIAIPSTTDMSQADLTTNTNFTAKGVQRDSSASYGGKVTGWTTATRAKTGLDVGIELDYTHFSPDRPSQTTGANGINAGAPVSSARLLQNDMGVRIVAVNALVRWPIGVTEALPHGRWYPYVGIGGGTQRASLRLSDGREEANTALMAEGLAGMKLFFTRRVAVFTEYKYTYADHTFLFDNTRSEIIRAQHWIFGLALHF
jgi:hypothetical protein